MKAIEMLAELRTHEYAAIRALALVLWPLPPQEWNEEGGYWETVVPDPPPPTLTNAQQKMIAQAYVAAQCMGYDEEHVNTDFRDGEAIAWYRGPDNIIARATLD